MQGTWPVYAAAIVGLTACTALATWRLSHHPDIAPIDMIWQSSPVAVSYAHISCSPDNGVNGCRIVVPRQTASMTTSATCTSLDEGQAIFECRLADGRIVKGLTEQPR